MKVKFEKGATLSKTAIKEFRDECKDFLYPMDYRNVKKLIKKKFGELKE